MTEVELWNRISQCMGNYWTAQRHEDQISPDVPDVSFTAAGLSGWIELKSSSPSGKRAVMIPKLRPGQLNWMKRVERHGGSCWVGWMMGDRFLMIPAHLIQNFDDKLIPDNWEKLATLPFSTGAVGGCYPVDIQRTIKTAVSKALIRRTLDCQY